MRTLFFLLVALLLLVFQTTVPDIIFSGKVGVELSLVLVIYAGFHLGFMEGALLSFLVGFVLDCLTGTISGLFTLLYGTIFIIAALFSLRVYAEKFSFIAVFTFCCSLLEGILIVFFFRLLYGVNMLQDIISVFLPQALIAGAVSPALFAILRTGEVLCNAGHTESAEQS
jgi:rod shape-determining protein MreD